MNTDGRRISRAAGCVLGFVLSLILAGCGGQSTTPEAPQAGQRRFQLRGKVVSIERDRQQIVVDHEEIPGFMAAMAMPYPVAEPRMLDAAQPGDEITADVVTTDTSAHLENIVVVRKAEPAQPAAQPQPQK
jgi:protein SCO1/2